jgi:hypothetical protein
MFVSAVVFDGWYREIAAGLKTLAMTCYYADSSNHPTPLQTAIIFQKEKGRILRPFAPYVCCLGQSGQERAFISSGCSRLVTVVQQGTDSVIKALAPMVLWWPITVSPPKMDAPA